MNNDDVSHTKAGKIISVIFIVSFILFCLYVIIIRDLVDEYGVETKGLVIDEQSTSESGRTFLYNYKVGNNIYEGSSSYDCNQVFSDSLVCKVKYLSKFPSISKAWYNGRFSGCKLP